MIKTDIKNDFLVYVIEEYKFIERKTAKELIYLFNKYNIYDYVLKHFNVLHTMGGRAISDNINLYIKS